MPITNLRLPLFVLDADSIPYVNKDIGALNSNGITPKQKHFWKAAYVFEVKIVHLKTYLIFPQKVAIYLSQTNQLRENTVNFEVE